MATCCQLSALWLSSLLIWFWWWLMAPLIPSLCCDRPNITVFWLTTDDSLLAKIQLNKILAVSLGFCFFCLSDLCWDPAKISMLTVPKHFKVQVHFHDPSPSLPLLLGCRHLKLCSLTSMVHLILGWLIVGQLKVGQLLHLSKIFKYYLLNFIFFLLFIFWQHNFLKKISFLGSMLSHIFFSSFSTICTPFYLCLVLSHFLYFFFWEEIFKLKSPTSSREFICLHSTELLKGWEQNGSLVG